MKQTEVHFPYFQWCTPSGDLPQLPLADSMALPGAALYVEACEVTGWL